ncbi:MAG: MBL fold metallo-hydrolase [Verrucomicrobiales bacterium]|nr:MBL fold metallo-hydrolase [Verrucomicrobiales bacterium]
MGALDFHYTHGAIHLPEAGLWLDAHRPIGPKEAVFVSHAHSDHTAAHARVLLTEPTRRLMRARVAGKRLEHIFDYGTPRDAQEFDLPLSDARITLLPAGHILGSAMILLEAEGTSLLYTGDFKLRPGLSAEPCQPHPADILIMETTFGLPKYRFPPDAEIRDGILRFCRETLSRNETPILLAYSLGKSQEALCGLLDAGLPIAVTAPVARMTAIYQDLGWRFPAYEPLESAAAPGRVIIAPPGSDLAKLRAQVGPSRVAVLSGWALDSSCRYQYRADAAFPLSDHADFPDLVEFVRRVAPRRVYTLHGFAAEFATHLRRLGIDARALGHQEQLEIPWDLHN